MAHVYILKSLNYKKTYVGSTSDLERRVNEHNTGQSFFTNRYKPWKLIYKEEFKDISDARKREKYFKTASGRKFIKNYIYSAVAQW